MKIALLVISMAVSSLSFAADSLRKLDVPKCHDLNNVVVKDVIIKDPSLGPAFSTVSDGAPFIGVNWAEMHKYATSLDTERFILEHECGHCALGHIYADHPTKIKTNQEELAADCYAAKQARALGIDINNVLKDVEILPRDPSHPSGQVRAQNIENCYQQN